jgi:putative tryptophan/tyrosine transport system substrate-binding protein
MFDLRRREFIKLLGGAATVWPLAARGQQAALPVVGFLYFGWPDTKIVASFHKGLNETGYFENRNVAVEFRSALNDVTRLPELAADLVRRRVAAIAAPSGTAALAAMAATTTIPIVFNTAGDPVKMGLVASLNRPGGNVTGVANLHMEVTAKRLALLRELLPKAAVVGPHSFFRNRRAQLLTLAARYAVPTIFSYRDDAEAGGLMSYGSTFDEYHQVGIYLGRILKGEKPADLPVMQASKFEFIINLQTAKALDIDIPSTLLALADEVIE